MYIPLQKNFNAYVDKTTNPTDDKISEVSSAIVKTNSRIPPEIASLIADFAVPRK